MNFLSLANAELSLSCKAPTAPVTAVSPFNAKITAKGTDNNKHVVFFESPIAGLDKCRLDIDKDGEFDLNLIGLLSGRGDGELSKSIQMLTCNANGEVKIPAIKLDVTRKFEAAMDKCQSTGDPHINAFNGHKSYDHFGKGDFWFAKSDIWDVQVHHEGVKGISEDAPCNTKVGIRYMDSVWVADMTSKTFHCNSVNGCKEFPMNVKDSPGKSVGTLPGNIEISINVNAQYMDVFLSVPGQESQKLGGTPSVCTPGKDIPSLVKDKTFAVTGGSYFGPAVTVPKPNAPTVPKGFTECKLPTSCAGVFPPPANPSPSPAAPSPSTGLANGNATATPSGTPGNATATPSGTPSGTPANPSPSPAAPSPSTGLQNGNGTAPPNPNGPKGVYLPGGFKPGHPTTAYKPTKPTTPAANTTTQVSPANATIPADALAKCKAGLPTAEMAILTILEQTFHFNACAADLRLTPLAIENTRQAVLVALQTVAKDVLATSQDQNKVKACQKVQTTLSLGPTPCNCGTNGFCSDFGCQCKTGFTGTGCTTAIPVPAAVQPAASVSDAALTKAIASPHSYQQGSTPPATSPADASAPATPNTPADTSVSDASTSVPNDATTAPSTVNPSNADTYSASSQLSSFTLLALLLQI